MTAPDILTEARALVRGPRQEAYGHPRADFARAALIWTAILGVDVTPAQVGLCLIGVKLSREAHKHGRDNLADIAGYAATVSMLYEPEPEEGEG